MYTKFKFHLDRDDIMRGKERIHSVTIIGLFLLGIIAIWAPAAEADEALKQQVTVLFMEKGCVGCHIIPGIPEAVGQIGPNLGHLKDKPRFAGNVLENTPENLRLWLRNPKEVKTTMMPNPWLTEKEITLILKYFKEM